MDYKNTLNLPNTDFSMKANLPQKEPAILKKWLQQGLYQKILENRQGRPAYTLHDGPPYANGDIHIGHALNKVLKDIIIKYKTMRGFYSEYVPGWDCHGLPVEHQLFKELKLTKGQIDQADFRKKAHAYAMRYVDIQREQFKRLGILGDWEEPYLTLDKAYEADILRAFGKLVKGGYIYKGRKPVNYCCVCETALAEAEVEYEEHTSPSVYVKFIMVTSSQLPVTSKKDEKIYFIIWTTTPWTLVANVAVAVHPDSEYAFVKVRDEIWVLLKGLVDSAMGKFGIKDFSVVKTLQGRDLEGLTCRHPFIDRDSKVVTAAYVSNLDGTGCVHTAPGHGQEDYMTGLKYNLPVIMPVDPKGNFDKTAGEFSGQNVHKANKPIINRLKASSALVFEEGVSHSYPHCWRCKNPVIFRATEQWFMSIDHAGLRQRMSEAINSKVKWIPAAGRERILSMVQNRPDWCLSRQRYWGVPIAAFYCRACGKELLDASVIEHVADIVEREGADAWFVRSEKELLSADTACKGCGKKEFIKESDIIDVWFDSGVSHQAVLKRRKGLSYPCELYLEGSDQHRGWFQSALITGMAIDGASPFKEVLTHGFVVDADGRKMSKSLGNVISPQDVIKNYGADILRLWVASSDYSEDIRLSDQILTRLIDAYRKIRNTYKFMLGNLSGFDPHRDKLPQGQMLEIDRWVLSETYRMLTEVTRFYDEFSFHDVFHCVYNFCVVQLSSFYLDILKDRLYIFGAKSLERLSGQTALFEVLSVITHVMAPILVFTADEAWQALIKDAGEKSIHLSDWPDAARLEKFCDKALEEKWSALIKVRQDVLKALELKREAGLIGSSLEAAVSLYSRDAGLQGLLKGAQPVLNSVFIVSGTSVSGVATEGAYRSDTMPIEVTVEKAAGQKCQRCWNYSEYVGRDSMHPALCERCVRILKGE